MKAINWKTAFWGKLRWNLIWGSWRKRSEIKLQKKARRKHDGLGSQLEDLETRVMLSGTTAVNDQAILKNVGVPVTLDVLSNDLSGNGQLNIVGASIVGGSGTVVIVDGQTGASGAAGRDQVKVTLASNYTGNTQIQYTIEDQSGNQSTAVATMQIGAVAGSAFNGSSSGSGALTVSGGTGGGHVVTPTDHYLPTESGNYSYSSTVLDAAYTAQGATGTQDITKTVTTTSYGVANWSYTELVTWVYDIYSNDGNGNTKHLYGGYTYTFSSVSVNGVITTTLAYVAGDHFDNNDVTTTATSTFSNHSWGTTNTVVTVINIDDVLDSGSIYYHNDSTTGSLGLGSYSRPMPGGSISGSMNGNSFGFNTLTMFKGYTQLTTGGFYIAGTVSMNGNGNNSFGYNGGGTYGDSSMMITASEDGGQSESYNYMGGGGFTSLAGWVLAGAGYTEGDQHSNFSYIGSGSYSREFHGGTMSGTQNANGHNKSSGDFRIDYSLNAAGWYITGGTNGGSGDSLSHFDYEGSGSYVFGQSSSGYSQTLSGSMSEDGHNTTRSNYDTSGTLNVPTMTWSYNGSGSGSGDNHDHLEYSGSGSYFREIHGGTVSGSANEDYNHNTSGSFATTSTLLPTGWVTAGSGAASGTSHNHTDYSGQGNYSRTEGTGNGQITYTGTQKQDGHTTVDQKWETKSFLAVTGLVTTYGSGSGTTDSHNYTYFSGSASYSRVTADGSGTISGKKNEEREDYEEQQAKTQTDSIEEGYGGFGTAISASGGGTTWSLTTGSATASGHGFAKTNWSGSGSYSKTTTNNQGNTVSTYTGNVFTEEKGHANSDYSASSKSTLLLDGTWFKTSGSGKSSGDNHDYSFTKSWGGYSKNTTGANGYESSYSGSYFNSSKAENFSNWDEKNSVIDGEFKQTAGNASGNGTTEAISSNSGGGTYSHNAGAYNSHISGSVNEDSYSRDATKYSTTSTWSSADGWTTSGTQSGDGTSRYHSDYSGKGRMNTISSLGSAYNSSSATTSLMGDVNENGETNNNSKYSSDYVWVEGSSGSVASGSGSGVAPTSSDWKLVSGSASDWGDGKTHVDWDGTGSYNSGGSDNRWGTWSVSGTTTSKGHTNTGNKWDTSSEVQTAASSNEKVWVTTGGSASDWGDSLKETTHSGSGSWGAWVLNGSITALFPGNGAYYLSGKVTHKGSTKDTSSWSQNSILDLSSTGAGSASTMAVSGNSWKVISGDTDGTGHMDDRHEFGYSSANYISIGNTWMTGSMSAYGYTQFVEDLNWHSVWSQSVLLDENDPEVVGDNVFGPGWYLQSGSGRVDETNGSGKSYSGSGGYSKSGSYSQEEGGGSWFFSASGTQSGKVEDGDGVFVVTSVQNGKWVATDAGTTASGFSEEKWQWDGTGQFTNGAMTGSFAQGAKSLSKDSYSFEYTESTNSTKADRDEEWDASGYNNYSASGTIYYLGVTGTYKEHGSGDWSSSGNVDYDWDTSIADEWVVDPWTLLIYKRSHEQWVAKSGTSTDESNGEGGNEFSGSSSYSAFGGGTTVSTRSFENSFSSHTNEQYSVLAQSAIPVQNVPAEGRSLVWTLSSGTHTEGSKGKYDSSDTTTGSYITPVYLNSGDFIDKLVEHSDYESETTSTFSSGAWNTTGSGTINANASGKFAYSGSESYATTGGSGTRSELQEDNWASKLTLNQTWVDTAGGGRPGGEGTVGAGGEINGSMSSSPGHWTYSGSASATADGKWEIKLNQTESWSPVVAGASLTGTRTTDYEEKYSYSSHADYVAVSGSSVAFNLTGGGGEGHGNGHGTITATASGSYSGTFDNGAGVINGTANASMREHWDYTGKSTLTLETTSSGSKNWVLSSSGSGNYDGFNNSGYSGSGSYNVTTTDANGYSKASGTWTESGHNNSSYSGKYDWEDDTWNLSQSSKGDSANDVVFTKYTEYSSTYTYNQDGYNNTSKSFGHSNRTEEWHSKGSSQGTYEEHMTASGLSWTRTGSGSYSSYSIVDTDSFSRYEWNNTYTSPNHTSFSNGYSSVSNDNYDRWDDNSSYSWVTHSDGSSQYNSTSGGSHAWNWSMTMSYAMAWGETTYYTAASSPMGSGYGGMSATGAGSGMGGSYSTGGSAAGGYTSGSAGSTGWAYSSNWSTPANPSGSGGGGTAGDGKQRWAAGGFAWSEGSGPTGLPEVHVPWQAVPDLGMGTVAGFDALGAQTWSDLSLTEAVWNGIDAVEDAFGWLSDQVYEMFDKAGQWIEDAGVWASQTFGWNGFEVAGSFLAGMVRDVGEQIAGMIDIPGQINAMIDTLSNLTMDDVLDGIQGALDVVGMIPVVGEIADGINGVVSLARGDYVGAALSFTSMIPVVGDAIGKGGKAARFIANKADDVLAAGKWIKCKVTGTGCFVAGTIVWVTARANDTSEEIIEQIGGSILLAPERKVTKEAIEVVAIGSRVAGVNPHPWEFDGELPEPSQATWLLGRFSLKKDEGNWIDVEMIRPAEYWETQEAVPGSYVYMEFPELQASGLALVKSIEPCPPIAHGDGHVVTSRLITRHASELVEIEIEGGEKLAGTPLHPIWIVEHQDWIELEQVEPGQHVWTEEGPLEIIGKRLLSTAESVYNIEVYGEHLYQVTDFGVLVHNSGGIKKYKTKKLKPGDKGTYGDLKKKKKKHGETEKMDIDHRPSYAAQVKAAEMKKKRKLTKKERRKLRDSSPAVATPRKDHQQKSRTYGGRNTPEQIAKDAKDLVKARARDNRAYR